MKIKIRQHILFWIGYVLFNFLQVYLSYSQLPYGKVQYKVKAIMYASFVDILPKILFSYLLYFFCVKPLFFKKEHSIISLTKGGFLIFTGVLVQRWLNFYFVFPVIYDFNLNDTWLLNISILFLTLFDFLVPIFLLFIYELFRFVRAAKEKESKLEKEKLKSELKYLKAQVNPHFLFNVLSTIHALSKNKAPEAANVVVKLAQLMRFMLFEVKNRQITIGEEVKFLEDYIELEKIRFEKKLIVSFEKKIDDENQKIAPLILLPFIENAFKHGAAESRFHSFVTISLVLNNKLLIFTVENSVENSVPDEHKTGIGLMNIKRQLELAYQQHELIVEERKESFFVSLKLNLTINEEIDMPDY